MVTARQIEAFVPRRFPGMTAMARCHYGNRGYIQVCDWAGELVVHIDVRFRAGAYDTTLSEIGEGVDRARLDRAVEK